jgi:hypothetical protein
MTNEYQPPRRSQPRTYYDFETTYLYPIFLKCETSNSTNQSDLEKHEPTTINKENLKLLATNFVGNATMAPSTISSGGGKH